MKLPVKAALIAGGAIMVTVALCGSWACVRAWLRRRRHRRARARARADVEHAHRLTRRPQRSPAHDQRGLELTGRVVPPPPPSPLSSVRGASDMVTESSTASGVRAPPPDAEAANLALGAPVRVDQQGRQEEPVLHLDYSGHEIDPGEAEPVRGELGEPLRPNSLAAALQAAAASSDSSSSSSGIIPGRTAEWRLGGGVFLYDIDTPDPELDVASGGYKADDEKSL